VLHHIIFIAACAQNVFLQHESKRWLWRHSATAC